ncbi:unnamed protein product [Bursaphelenchus okinawaensis]|uniref:Uracil-DNA glycosylase n=1 Tax=Bursaphelenchus okinawaensis TaxID=465554 RepID=A0A811KCR6_9BILA|nr:unnamed protein product [Bursaphelenchus okinawaensis]CAG9100570.1 unnamed protein product [Bursaphelenchus okinawaensis]
MAENELSSVPAKRQRLDDHEFKAKENLERRNDKSGTCCEFVDIEDCDKCGSTIMNFEDLSEECFNDARWKEVVLKEFSTGYMKSLKKKLDLDMRKGFEVFPPLSLIFNAFNLTPFEKIKVVIIGQDPYHNPGEAMGLSFSVPEGVKIPPSLRNIYKELRKEYSDFVIPTHGNLIKWAEQGVFLLNATLTVIKNKANSHSEYGWQKFTDNVIRAINRNLEGVVFMLWGNFAQKKANFIDVKKHTVIKTAHPSPLSYRKFEDCKCFTKVNKALEKYGKDLINWTDL